jgi:hypothetical protein
MNLLLSVTRLYVPAFYKKKKLQELFQATAEAFNREVPKLSGPSYGESLRQYALFTKECAESAISQNQNLQEIKRRLYQNAFQLGWKLGKALRVSTREDAMRLAQKLYGVLTIDFQGNPQGEIIVSRCFFSQFYSASVCWIISSLDEGVLAGLAGGGRLIFSQRITEGSNCCKAQFFYKENGR